MPEEVFETPQPTQTTESKQTNWPKMVLIAVLGFGLLAGAAYAGYYYGTQQVQQPEKPTPVVSQPTPKPTPTPIPTSTVEDETTDWKTYIDPNNIFMLKYPAEFYATELRPPVAGEIRDMRDTDAGALSTVQPWNEVRKENDMLIEFFITTKKATETSLEVMARTENRTVEEIKDGASATKEIVVDSRRSYWWEGESMSVPYVYVSILKDESTFVIVRAFGELGVSTKQKELLEKILSTFKFLD